jgi:serine phosphatase RsbU (regulator of sigma subunit)
VVAVALQSRLQGLVGFVRSLELTDRDAIAVLTDDFRVLAMSDDPRLWHGPPDGWVLKRPSELGSSLVADALEAFALRAEGERGPLQFLHRGEMWWTQLRRFPLGGDSVLFISVLVPDTDLGENRSLIRLSILAITTVALLTAVLGSMRLARRVSEPIEILVRNSERIRRGDLTGGQTVSSRLLEVEELAAAQERMRVGLRSLLKLEGDLQAARRIQQSSLPDELPAVEGWDVAGWSEPAEETGGDAYDAIPLGDALEPTGALLLVADATGHGIGAALSAVRVAAMVRIGARAGDDLPTLARLLNEELCAGLPGNRFVSAWLGRIDAASGELATFSAGLAPLLLLRQGAARVQILAADVPPLGLRREVSMTPPPALEMERGDLFVAVTDGLFEATDADGEELGIERIARVLVRERQGTAEQILEALRREVEAFTGNVALGDDRTVVVIKRVV